MYKFINKNFNTSANPLFVLGAETPAFSSGGYGFRMTFTQEDYIIDEDFHRSPDGTASQSNEQDATELYFLSSSHNDSNYLNGKKGPHNPKWNNEFTSFKRGECYRFGIVFFDKKGTPGFAHHLGDIKMPDAMDSNIKVMNSTGDAATDKGYNAQNKTWSPFSSDASTGNSVYAHALIPKIEVRLPTTVLNVISGYRIVRAELQDDDKIIITQGLLNQTSRYHDTEGSNTTLENKIHGPGQILHNARVAYTTSPPHTHFSPTYAQYRNSHKLFTIDNTDVTLRNMSYNLSSGYLIRPVSMLLANRLGTSSSSLNHKRFGYDTDSNMDSGSVGTGFHVTKFKPWPTSINGLSAAAVSEVTTTSSESFLKWVRPVSMAKTVVNQEIITTEQHGSSADADYINQSAVFADNIC